MRRAVEVGHTLGLILLTSIQRSGDNSLSLNILVTKVGTSISALQLSLHAIDIDRSLNGVQVSILPHRTDMILRDLILIGILTAITNQSSTSNFLFEVTLHNITLISDNIKISDIDNIITMQCITEVNSLRIGGPHQNLHVSGDSLLLFTLGITLSTDLGGTCINLLSTNTRDRALVSLSQNLVNPIMIPLKQLRSTRINILIVREQTANL